MSESCSYCGAAIEQTPEGPLYRCRSTCPEPSFHGGQQSGFEPRHALDVEKEPVCNHGRECLMVVSGVETCGLCKQNWRVKIPEPDLPECPECGGVDGPCADLQMCLRRMRRERDDYYAKWMGAEAKYRQTFAREQALAASRKSPLPARDAGTPSPGFVICPSCRGYADHVGCLVCEGKGEMPHVIVPDSIDARLGYCLECGMLADVLRRGRDNGPEEFCFAHDPGEILDA